MKYYQLSVVNANSRRFFRLTYNRESNISEQDFRESVRQIAQIKEILGKQDNQSIFNILPDYFPTGEKIAYDTAFHEGSIFNAGMSDKEFFLILEAICQAISVLNELCCQKIIIPMDSIICEPKLNGTIHVLYLTSEETEYKRFHAEFSEIIAVKILLSGRHLHPLCRRNAEKLCGLMQNYDKTPVNWEYAKKIAAEINLTISRNDDFFLHSMPKPEKIVCCPELSPIKNKLSDSQILFLQSDTLQKARQIAIQYAENYYDSYIHILLGNGSYGIKFMIESKDFALNSETEGFHDRYRKILQICQQKTLIIVCGYKPEIYNDFKLLHSLKNAYILIPTDTDYSDYGMICINI